MRYALLVAWREYAENAKTKGFWIGIFLFPLIIGVSITVQQMLEEATPTRLFVLVDHAGGYEQVVEDGLERMHLRRVLQAFQTYVGEHGESPDRAGTVDLESMPAPESLESFSSVDEETIRAFADAGGVEGALERVRPLLDDDAPGFEEPRPRFQRVPLPLDAASSEGDIDALAEGLKPYLTGDRKIVVDGEERGLFAAILIPADIASGVMHGGESTAAGSGKRIRYWASNLADEELRDEIEDVINAQIRRAEYLRRGLDADTIQSVQRTRIPWVSLNPKKAEGKEEVSVADKIRQWAPVGFVYLLWIGIFSIAQMLLNNTIEEKSNRIIEVLLSSVTAGELMMGKLIGIAAVGLTMILAWIGCLVGVLSFYARGEAEFATQALEVLQGSGLLPAFLIYFLLGYLLYSGIFLSIGSVCNTLKEAQNLMGPVMLVMIVPLFTMMFIPKDPNGTLATVMSWIPLYTPFVMMNRAAAHPPLFDLVGTLVVLTVTTAGVLWLAGRIFRVGILRTGQPPKLLELLRWVRS